MPGAVVLTRADRAQDCAKKPVYVRGTGEGTEHVSVTQMKGLPLSEAAHFRPARFCHGGVTHRDFDHIMLYDAFTSGPPYHAGVAGFAKPGEGVHFFANGKSTPAAHYRSTPTVAACPTPTRACMASSDHRSHPPAARRVRGAAGAQCQAIAGQWHGWYAFGSRYVSPVTRKVASR